MRGMRKANATDCEERMACIYVMRKKERQQQLPNGRARAHHKLLNGKARAVDERKIGTALRVPSWGWS